MPSTHDSLILAESLLKQKDQRSRFKARQLLFLNSRLSKLVELYLYNNERQPQKLDEFPMMVPIYDGLPKKLLLKCSRKTLKSTLISNIIVLNMIRYSDYHMMYVSPDEAGTKRFSHDYLSARLASPPIKQIISGLSRNDVFIKEVEDSKSSVMLTYASTDADRTRGPSVASTVLDESIFAEALITVFDGKITHKKIVDTRVGDIVLCKDDKHHITTDRVINWKSEGRRHTWRITLDTGNYIECTSRTRIFTNLGWLYLTQLLPKSEIDRCEKARYFESTYGPARTTNTGNSTRRWLDASSEPISVVSGKPQLETEGLRATQSPDNEKLHKHPSEDMQQSRMGGSELLFLYGDYSRIRFYTESMLREGGGQVCKNSEAGMGGQTDLGRHSLLVHGRRVFDQERQRVTPTYRRISERTSDPVVGVADFQGAISKTGAVPAILLNQVKQGGSCEVYRTDQTVYNTVNEIQGGSEGQAMPLLQLSDSEQTCECMSESRVPSQTRGDNREQIEREGSSLLREEQGQPSVPCCQESYQSKELSEPQGYTRIHSTMQGCERTEKSYVESRPSQNAGEAGDETSVQYQEPVETKGYAGTAGKEPGLGCETLAENQERSGTTGQEACLRPDETTGEESTNIKSIEYVGEQEVYDIETEKYHNFFANDILVHNCQGMDLDILPVIAETMSILRIRREIFAGTPMTTDNTIHQLWKRSNQMEWAMKCSSCNHWNTLTEDNEPMRMIQKKGLCCSKCGSILNSKTGMWADFNPGDRELQGYHLAQPIIPFYNTLPSEWSEIYQKCYERDYAMLQVYNEVLGLSYDVGAKPITEEKLKSLCVLGEMATVYQRRKGRYVNIFMAVDWGVSAVTSRTVGTLAGLRDDGIIEIFYVKVFKDMDYEQQIRELARLAKDYLPWLTMDSGPDPIRGRMLGNMYDPNKSQMVSYRDTVFTQFTDTPATALDWSQTRWCLHRSDVMGFTMDLLKKDQILFPRWEDCGEAMQDILAVFTEVKEDNLKAKVFYRHTNPDDFFHTITWIASHAHLSMNNMFFLSPSSSSDSETS